MNYIGNKGYSIFKTSLNETLEKKIKKDLVVKPFIPKGASQFVYNQDNLKFTIYRESLTRYYLPRYYGIEEFGNEFTIKLPEGKMCEAMEFAGSLRDYQENICSKFINHIKQNAQNIDGLNYTYTGGGCLEIDTGMGKTVMAIYIMSLIKRKTLIVVHKEFLVNQWIERIQEFMPNVKIGKIQGKITDVEDCGVVIAMLQSLSMKAYDQSVFSEFGFMIIDEVHHMGAEVFSRALNKVVTNCTLGLSATMERKDGLTRVFKLFLGPTIHVEKRDTSSNRVLIRTLHYEVNDDDYNETHTDYRGNVQFSKMISKLCDYNRRSDFILQYIAYFMEDDAKHNRNQQLMILGHNKSLLKYIHDGIIGRNIAEQSVGYYVGGMKESDLKISETKKIVIATYSMASEGLDIKTLTSLMMITPKTDIVQAVGRILRSKHKHCQPCVIDLIDSHEIFKRQYKQRQKFYNQQNYKIVSWNHKHHLAVKNDGSYVFDQYNNDLWNTIYDYVDGKYVRISKKNKKMVEENTIDQELSVLINDL